MKVKIEAEGWETAPEWENARRILALARDEELDLSARLRLSIVLCGDVLHYEATGVPAHSSPNPSSPRRPFFVQRQKDINPIIYILEE